MSSNHGLPLWARLAILGSLLALLIFNVVWDATHQEYDGAAISLMLGGFVGGAIALDQNTKRKE